MIKWKSLEFTQYERGKNWHIILVIVAGALAIMAIAFQYWTSLILVFLATAVLWMKSYKKPRQIEFSLTEKGLDFDNRLYPFSDFQSFGIIENPHGEKIIFRNKKIFSHSLEIYFNSEDKEKIKEFLLKYLPEKEEEESLLSILERLLKI